MNLTKEQLNTANVYLQNGKKLIDISREFNINIDSFKLQFLTAGYKLPNYKKPDYLTDEIINLIKNDIKNGLSIRNISKNRGLGNDKSLKLDLLQIGIDLSDKGKKYLTKDFLDKFLRLHESGAKITTIKNDLKLKYSNCYEIYEHLNLKPNKEVSIYDEENIVKLKQLHSEGLHNSGIGNVLGFDNKTVNKALIKLGLVANTFDGTRKLTQEEKEYIIKKHHVEKVPYTYLAIEMGFKDSVFKRECENNGIELYIRNIVDLTKEQIDEIVRLNIEEEYGLGMLCEKFQYSYSYLTNQLNKNNITLKRYLHGKRVIFSEDEINKMIELNQQGFSREYIADCFNTYEDMISKTIKRNKLNFMDNRFSNITEELFEVIKQRNDNGEGINKIAEDLKLSHKTIANEFNKRNLKHITYSQYFNKEVGVNDGFLHYDNELMTKLTDEYKSGSSIKELCEKYSLNKKTLRQNLVFNDVEIRDFRVIFNDNEIADIISSYVNGISSNILGNKYNCHKGIITDILKENCIEVVDKRIYQFTDEQIKTMITKYVDFEYDAETIGKMFDAPGIVIIKHLKLNGVETRSSNSSMPERLLNRFIKGFIDKDVLGNPRGFISSGEIDILSHEYKIGVEYNGLLWHSDKYEKGKNVNYHLDKTNEVESKGYKLLHIFEDEYLDREFLIFNKILESFNIDKYVGSDFDYLKMLDFKTTEEFLLNVNKLYTLKDKINVTNCKIENNDVLEDVLISKLSLDIESDYNKSFHIKHENKKIGVITVKDNIIKEILINPVYKITDINKLIESFVNDNNIKGVILDRRWFNENNMFKSFAKEKIITDPKRYYVKGNKRFECEDVDVEYYKGHAIHKLKFDEGLTKDEFLAKCSIFSIYDCGRIVYHF